MSKWITIDVRNKWITVKKKYENNGFRLTVSCKSAGIHYQAFVKWGEDRAKKIDELIKKIEKEIIGDIFDLENAKVYHYSSMNSENILVTTVVKSYPLLKLSVHVQTDNETKQIRASEKAWKKVLRDENKKSCLHNGKNSQVLEMVKLLSEFALVKALSNPPLQRDAHTRAQIKSRTQLNWVYVGVSTPELSNVRLRHICSLMGTSSRGSFFY